MYLFYFIFLSWSTIYSNLFDCTVLSRLNNYIHTNIHIHTFLKTQRTPTFLDRNLNISSILLMLGVLLLLFKGRIFAAIPQSLTLHFVIAITLRCVAVIVYNVNHDAIK